MYFILPLVDFNFLMFQFYYSLIQFWYTNWIGQFSLHFEKETVMKDGQDGPLQLISAEIIFDIQGRVIFMFFVGFWLISVLWCSSFNIVSLRFNIGIEIWDGRDRPLQLISMEFFLTFFDD